MSMRRWTILVALGLAACGEKDGTPSAPTCSELASADFQTDSGWGSADYCDVPTDLGCYPWHASTPDTCGPFTTMRTSATPDASATACETIITALNCGEYAAEDGSADLSFFAESADRFTMHVTGTYNGSAVDTTFYFNPCHQNCQAAVTLVTLDPDQQKICEIPRQGKPACLFPETAHSMTFVRADGGSIVIRTAGKEVALARVVDAP